MNLRKANNAPMPDPLEYFLTWTTYGTWLPGDQRGWVMKGQGIQLPDPIERRLAADRMTEAACYLDEQQRAVVQNTIDDHCRVRRWKLHAVNCRSNHVHVVVSADRRPEDVRDQFKAWCTRKLKELQRFHNEIERTNWWTEGASHRYIGDEDSLAVAIHYVLEAQ